MFQLLTSYRQFKLKYDNYEESAILHKSNNYDKAKPSEFTAFVLIVLQCKLTKFFPAFIIFISYHILLSYCILSVLKLLS